MCGPLGAVEMFKRCLENITALLSKLWIMEFSIWCDLIKYVALLWSLKNMKGETWISSHFINKDHHRSASRVTNLLGDLVFCLHCIVAFLKHSWYTFSHLSGISQGVGYLPANLKFLHINNFLMRVLCSKYCYFQLLPQVTARPRG